MVEQEQKEREAFELEYAAMHSGEPVFEMHNGVDGPQYICDRTQEAYEIWKAAIAHESVRTQQAAVPDEITRLKDIISDWEYAASNIDRLVRELDAALNGEDGAARQASLCDIVAQVKAEGIKATPAQPDKAEVVERFAMTIAENLHMDEDDPRIVRAARILSALPPQRDDSGLVLDVLARAYFDADPASGWTTWEKLSDSQRDAYREDAKATIARAIKAAQAKGGL